jgi:ribonuclease P protein component
MLPSAVRVHARAEHAQISRGGRRVRRGPIVVHYLVGRPAPNPGPARAGFVVGRAVGNAVVRNRVRRRLREQVRPRLSDVAPGTLLVVRALPESAIASSEQLGRALDGALRAVAAATSTAATSTGSTGGGSTAADRRRHDRDGRPVNAARSPS